MLPVNVNEEYLRALHAGQKEKKRLEAAGKDPFPVVFDEAFPEERQCSVIDLPAQEIPIDRIVGTKTKGRMNAFSASFLPLMDENSEFAFKWKALCEAHLSDAGIRDSIVCYEYLGSFYVLEGNKRLSVLRYFGAVSISAQIRRILPPDRDDPLFLTYREFTEFQKTTGNWDIRFKKPGEYRRLFALLDKKSEDVWSDEEKHRLSAAYYAFKTAFGEIGGKDPDLLPEDALLLFLRVYGYDALCRMSKEELKKALSSLWQDVRASSDPGAITVQTLPKEDEKLTVIGKLITAVKRLNVAFICGQDEETSPWTAGHLAGVRQLETELGESISVRVYLHADGRQETQTLLERAVKEGAELVFTTTPPMLRETLQAAVRCPKVRFFNCSACRPLSSVRSYYCRTYEGKFVTGLIAGALADNDLVGYVGSYPILGVPASINAFALGVRMTNPRARVLLRWSCLPGDPVASLRERGVKVISNRDIPLPDARYMDGGSYGTFLVDRDGAFLPLASPCWMWGTLYTGIVRAALSGSLDKKEPSGAVNYWWGMDGGVIDVAFSDHVPAGVRTLAANFIGQMKAGSFQPFSKVVKESAEERSGVSERPLSSLEILQMNCLHEAVEGRFPEYNELLPVSRTLVRELGAHLVEIPPETEEEP